ncbi:hypothetical protein NKR23_g1270 [Pleurostoma richardsiae]|uniref:Uncharacterized protein n=1 Tax=Pleurostoma richardsiae TaxID=41990 RepID=A0AA38RSY8_9PEZI|nr:hypothetical protein NKR23_g1270 [Pleurostoma richardsiae]
MAPPIALIFGSGANIGAAVAKRFLSAGYRVATVSRSAPSPPALSADGRSLSVRADLAQPRQVPGVFAAAASAWPDSEVGVVVWNAAGLTPPPQQGNLFSVPAEALARDLDLMVTAPFVAAGEAFGLWTKEGGRGKGVFVMTGNMFAKVVVPLERFTTLGVSKSGAAYWVAEADMIYREKGIRFFYADERQADGKPMSSTPGAESHAEMYLYLAQGATELPSYVTFVDGKYVKF